MKRFENFELKEFLQSETAKQKKIDNFPTFEEVENIEKLVSTILQPLRTAYGKVLKINSGFRSDALNKAVGGVSTSAHRTGYAADVYPMDGDVDKLAKFAEKWMNDNNIKWDQSILEKDNKGNKWWHIGLYDSYGNQRCQSFELEK